MQHYYFYDDYMGELPKFPRPLTGICGGVNNDPGECGLNLYNGESHCRTCAEELSAMAEEDESYIDPATERCVKCDGRTCVCGRGAA